MENIIETFKSRILGKLRGASDTKKILIKMQLQTLVEWLINLIEIY